MPDELPRVYEGDRDYIFACYSHDDRDAVLPIIGALVGEGYRVWYDDGIELTGDYPEDIANHVYGCACLVMFVSRASLGSDWCRQEVNYALDLGKRILPIYIEDVELTRGLQMRMGNKQALFWLEYDSDEAFNNKLFKARRLDSCLTDEGRRRRGVKPRGAVQDKAVDPAVVEPRRVTARVVEHEVVEPIVVGDESNEPGDVQPKSASQLVAKPVDSEPPKVLGVATPHGDKASPSKAANAQAQPAGGKRVGVQGVEKRSALAEYSWAELKALSQRIASADSDAVGLEIAKAYGLVGTNGRLQGATKPLKLKDGTDTGVRILGFRHDELASGGTAGISFEFADVPVTHRMNPTDTNEGGWEKSEMREWLNKDFFTMLPDDLRSLVGFATKRTNNKGKVGFFRENDTSVVTAKSDKLWLLSMSEVYGKLSAQKDNAPWSPATYDAEGIQYQLYKDKGVSTINYSPCTKRDGRGASSWWWLRSPDANYSDGFWSVDGYGDWSDDYANLDGGVSPGFCF